MAAFYITSLILSLALALAGFSPSRTVIHPLRWHFLILFIGILGAYPIAFLLTGYFPLYPTDDEIMIFTDEEISLAAVKNAGLLLPLIIPPMGLLIAAKLWMLHLKAMG
jgi:hypothetical protein